MCGTAILGAQQKKQGVRAAETRNCNGGPPPICGRILVTGRQGNHAVSAGIQGNQVTESNREFYRLTYPRSGRPELVIKGKSYAVAEISEHGMRVQLQQEDMDTWPIGEAVHGKVIFSDGGSFNIVGLIVRHADLNGELQCAASLSEGIPYARMVAEQRFMMQIFPATQKPE